MDTQYSQHSDSGGPAYQVSAQSNDNELVSRSAARAALCFLEEAGSRIPHQLRRQVDALYKDLLRDLGHEPHDAHIILTPDQLRGVIASAVITGAAQIAIERNVAYSSGQKEEAPKDLNYDPLKAAFETS
jgi:hypothetical protein